ncbi:zinc finger protein 835 [Trichonephila clavipes]|uniref:Zinc finger protein 835 n=1 Tax=Trichonephila clavipes TaxID=2585209 RepID=A0A8X6WGQ6_TRICX|nr:zinc finger protein 835 [Trichonephila clavipes]
MNHMCDICKTKFKTVNDLNEHLCVYVEKKKQLIGLHTETFGSEICFSEHLRIYSEKNALECNVCDEVFIIADDLIRHLYIHLKRDHTCSGCNEAFCPECKLRDHFCKDAVKKACMSNIFNNALINADYKHKDTSLPLKANEMEIRGNKSFIPVSASSFLPISCSEETLHVCNICDMRFAQKFELDSHYFFHTGERSYQCDVCNQIFTHENVLERHMLKHKICLKQKFYKCNICEQLFRDTNTLWDHVCIPTGEKPHVCDVCNKGFTQSDALRNHSLVHVEIKPYNCVLCDKKFSFKSDLNQHYLTHAKKNFNYLIWKRKTT